MRKLVSFFIDNPLIVNVILLTLMIMGIIVGYNLRKESYPDITFNVLRITTNSDGSSLRDTELLISKPIEDQLKTISGIEKFQSYSYPGSSRLNVWLNVWGTDKYEAVQEIREAVSIASKKFPPNADSTVIKEIKADDDPVIRYQVRSSTLSPIEMHNLLRDFQQTLEGISGVAQVDLSGYREREVQINFDNQNMLKQSVSVLDLQNAVHDYVVRESAGNLNGPGINRNIALLTDFEQSKDIADINIRRSFNSNGTNVKDIATVKDGLADETILVRGNLDPGITVSVYKEDAEDNFKVLDRIQKVVDKFKQVIQKRYNRVPKEQMDMLNRLEHSPFTIGIQDSMIHQIVDGYGYNVDIESFADATKETKNLLNITKNNAYLGIILVFFSLWLFLDFRIAFWTSFSIPLVILLTMIVVFFLGYSINNIMLFGMITVLGILVDDGIIVSENIYRLRALGYTPREAAIEGVMQLAAPLLATVLTTICAFLPLILVNKIDFLYIRQMPLIIIITLLMSLVEVFLSLPSHIAHAKETKDYEHLEKQKNLRLGDKLMIGIKKYYIKNLLWITKWRYLVFIGFIFMIILAVFLSHKIKFVYYSNEENDEIRIRMEAPNGTNLEEMNQKVSVVERKVLKQLGGIGNPILSMFTTVGSGMLTPTDSNTANANEATIRLYLSSFSDRKMSSSDIVRELETVFKTKNTFIHWLDYPYIRQDIEVSQFIKKPNYSGFIKIYGYFKQFRNPSSKIQIGYNAWLKDYNKREIKVTNSNLYSIFRDEMKDFMNMKSGFTTFNISEPRFGPRQSNPISLIITGNNDEYREKAMQEIYNFLSGINGVFGIEEQRNDTGLDFFLNLDVRKMEQLGVTPSDVATSVRAAFLGAQVGTIANADESIDINVILSKKDRNSLNNLENIPIPTNYRTVIPLKNITKLELHQDVSSIVRENGKRASTITADADLKQIDVRAIGVLLDRYIPEILVKYPGIGIVKSGELADIEETGKEAMIITMIGFVGIFFILLFVFKTLSQPIFVLSVLPFGVIGVIFAFVIHGQAMSFFGIIGLIGLMGVIINDAIVMVDYINVLQTTESGQKTFIEIVCQGSAERIRAVLLTTFTTVAGLLPAVYGWGGSVSVLRPLAMSMAYGLLFGTLITLILIPCLYIINQDIKNSLSFLRFRFLGFIKGKKNG